MTAQQRIVRIRRTYNQWVANQTLEDYALRFTAKSARKWSSLRVANTAIGAISFLALEAIGGAITINYGFTNATAAILVVGFIILLTSLPITYYAATYGVDIDLLTRGAGFGYIGSTITSLIYASFTFIFFAIEAAIMSLALEMCFDIPLPIGYVVSSVVIIPLVTHGITFISRFQLWTQPIWLALHILPFIFIVVRDFNSIEAWTTYPGASGATDNSFNVLLFGAATTVVFSLIAQIGEQVDFLRFLPPKNEKKIAWWLAFLSAGPGWIIPGALKLMAGSFLAYLAIQHLVPPARAVEPTQMYLVAFQYVFSKPEAALLFTGAFVIVSQIKINVTNAYAGSIAWSNFFSRLTHSHPGRVVWLVFNVAIALTLMELGIFKALEHTLGIYSLVAVAWVGALVADLVVNKPLGWSPAGIEFKRAHLCDINPAGVGSMILAACTAIVAHFGLFGSLAQALSAFIALAVSFVAAPVIAFVSRGRFYIARQPSTNLNAVKIVPCSICEHPFEPEDMSYCPVYSGPICSLCCSLDARCHDACKPGASITRQLSVAAENRLPPWLVGSMRTDVVQYLGVLSLFILTIGLILLFVYFQVSHDSLINPGLLQSTLWKLFFILTIVVGIVAWLFVLAHESRRVAEEETRRQTELLIREIEAHKRTDAKLQKAKEVAEAASNAKSRYVVGLSHELRTPLNAILGYARILERDSAVPAHRTDAIRVVRRSAEHLSGLIDGLLDISKIEAGRFSLNRNEVRIAEFLDQLVDMFRLQAKAKGIEFRFVPAPHLPAVVSTDESRLRQILINLLSNAIKFTDHGHVTLRVGYRNQVARFDIEDSGIGIDPDDLARVFLPFERARTAQRRRFLGTGLGLTITKRLTETMGGELSVRSEVGVGSAFSVRLLLSEVERPRSVPAIENRIRGYTGARQTILIADDDEAQRQLMSEFLAPLGFNVMVASSGQECLKLAEQYKPNLIFLDVLMFEMDGWEVARRLQLLPAGRPAIVMVSALAADKAHDMDTGRLYDAYLMKPVEFTKLLETIHTLVNIEWIYEPAAAQSRTRCVADLPSDAVPGRETLDNIISLAKSGHLRGIEGSLDEIKRKAPHCLEFVDRVQSFVDNLDFEGCVSELTEVLGRHD
jgi:signal transduction histidine kinase/CheY-like chemotaxis protein